jgi:crossover junction endodeoxyribonuclease RuvC
MVMLAAAHRGLELFEYTPTDVKLSIAGYGRADKRQVKAMVQRTLGGVVPDDLAADATDALARSLCHIFRAKMPRPRIAHKSFPRNIGTAIAVAGVKP